MSCMCPRSSLRAYVVGRVRGPCCGMLYIFTLVPGLAAIHFCSGAGACCNTLLAWRGPARSGKESDEEWRRVARRVTRNGEESVPDVTGNSRTST